MNIITLDFETYYDKDYTLSKMTTEAYVRDPRFEVIGVGVKVNDEPAQWFSGSAEMVRAWLHQFDIRNNILLCHHAAFDGFILSQHFDTVPRMYLDTLSMARPENGATVGLSLKALADKYTVGVKGDDVFHAIGKHRADFTPEELASYGQYCCGDVQLTYLLFRILNRNFPRSELHVIDVLVRMFTDPVLLLDKPLLEKHLADVKEKKEALLLGAGLVNKDDLMSNDKFAALLQGLGVTPPTKVSMAKSASAGKQVLTYAFSKTDVKFRELLEHPDLRVQALVAARLGVKSTLEETRTQAFIDISERGTLPVYLHYYGGHTGRASGGDRINLQNLTRGSPLREAIYAPEGYVLVVGDSSQIEARMTAWLSGQEDLVAAFANGEDIYSSFASRIYGRHVDRKNNPQDKEPGFVGKTCILGLGFGMGGAKLCLTLKNGKPPVIMREVVCWDIVRLYQTTYSCIPKLWKAGDVALEAIVKGEEFHFGVNDLLRTTSEGILLPNGMQVRYPKLTRVGRDFVYAKDRRQHVEFVKQKLQGQLFPDKLTNIYGAKVIENVVQALARIVVFNQMLELRKVYRIALTVHDELVACVPAALADKAREDMTRVMSCPPPWAPGLPVACEVNIGRTYGEAK